MRRRWSSAAAAVGMLLASGCAALDLHPASLTFRIDSMACSPATAASTVCSFFAYYGNVGAHSIQVEPGTTRVLDRTGKTFAPVAEADTGGSFLLKPGLQHAISWSVTLPSNVKPARVTWHGSKVPVQLDASPGPSASAPAPSASAVPSVPVPSASAPPSSAVPTTTPAPTTTKPIVKPKPKPKPLPAPTKPTVKPTIKATTIPPTTPAPPTSTHRPVVHHPTPAPTTNSTNPGGGSGGIG